MSTPFNISRCPQMFFREKNTYFHANEETNTNKRGSSCGSARITREQTLRLRRRSKQTRPSPSAHARVSLPLFGFCRLVCLCKRHYWVPTVFPASPRRRAAASSTHRRRRTPKDSEGVFWFKLNETNVQLILRNNRGNYMSLFGMKRCDRRED